MDFRPVKSPAVLSLSLLAFGCLDVSRDEELAVRATQAISVCNETVPGNRIVDGIPAYSQCAASNGASIYSNNGVDTATTAASNDWKQTQRGGGYQCTELLHRYWLFRWNVTWLPNGDAGTWCSSIPPSSSGIVQSSTPVHGDAIVFAPGACGASATYGHVALIDTVDSTGSKVTFVEQNDAGRRTSAWSCATCFLHVLANDGSSGGVPATGGASANTVALGGNAPSGGRTGQLGGTSSSSSGAVWSRGGSSTSNSGGSVVPTGGRNSTGGFTTTSGGDSHAVAGRVASGGSTASLSAGGTAPTGSGGASISADGIRVAGGQSSTSDTGYRGGSESNSRSGGTRSASGGTSTATSGGSPTMSSPSITTQISANVGGSEDSATRSNVVMSSPAVAEDAGWSCRLAIETSSSRSGAIAAFMALAFVAQRRRSRKRPP